MKGKTPVKRNNLKTKRMSNAGSGGQDDLLSPTARPPIIVNMVSGDAE